MTEGISPDIKRAYNRPRYEKSREYRRRYYLEHREERPAYGPTRQPEYVPDRAAARVRARPRGNPLRAAPARHRRSAERRDQERETIRKLLDGSTRRPTASLMMQLARLFDCEVEDLMREARDGDD